MIQAHRRVLDVFRTITGRNHRSLVSKCLHFHAPAVLPIFDRRAERALRARLKDQKCPSLGNGDPDYARFVARAVRFMDLVQEQYGFRPTPRQLDRLLLGY